MIIRREDCLPSPIMDYLRPVPAVPGIPAGNCLSNEHRRRRASVNKGTNRGDSEDKLGCRYKPLVGFE
jgi:hypothetical protein